MGTGSSADKGGQEQNPSKAKLDDLDECYEKQKQREAKDEAATMAAKKAATAKQYQQQDPPKCE